MQTYDSMLDSCSVLPQDGMTSAPSLEAARMAVLGPSYSGSLLRPGSANSGKVSKPCTVQKSVRWPQFLSGRWLRCCGIVLLSCAN